ncbi:hypothetical protein niasHS_004071 [Heterodera schachtii]|uniref:ShKT domain-containing protein n=2 Tax=Heterodera TaxID=34509 RepID=A0ABD2JUY3_HETSC
MNARRSFTVSLLLLTICLLQLLLLLNMNGVHCKKRRHRPAQRGGKIEFAARTNKTIGIGIKNQICADDKNGILPPQQPQQERQSNPWAWKSDDNSFPFDRAAVALSAAEENSTSRTRTSSNPTSTETMPTTKTSSSMTVTAQKLNDERQRGMAQRQQQAERSSGGEAQEQRQNAKFSSNEPTVPKLKTAPTTMAQRESWITKAEELAEIGRNQLKPCNKFTGDSGDVGVATVAPNSNHSLSNAAQKNGPTVGQGQQQQQSPLAPFDPVFGTLPPGFEPSSPAFAFPDESGLNNNKLAEFDVPSQTQQPSALNSINNSIDLSTTHKIGVAPSIETSTISGKNSPGRNGTDLPKYWTFTRLPFINRTELANSAPPSVPIVPSSNNDNNGNNNNRAREEESWSAVDLELKPPHLGQADFFTPNEANQNKKQNNGSSAGERQQLILDITKCQREGQSADDKVPTEKEAEQSTVALVAPQLVDTVYTEVPEVILPAADDLSGSASNKPEMSQLAIANGTVAAVPTQIGLTEAVYTVIERQQFPPATAANTVIEQQQNAINFDAPTEWNKTVDGLGTEKQNIVGDEKLQQRDEYSQNKTDEFVKTKGGEDNCCNLLCLLKSKNDNETIEFAAVIDGIGGGEPPELLPVTELRGQQQKPQKSDAEVISDNKLDDTIRQTVVEGEHEAEVANEESGTVKANWKVIEEASTTTATTTTTTQNGGLEILKEDLREENFQLIQNHAISSDRISPTESTPFPSSDNSIVTAVTAADNGNIFPWTTSAPVISKKWTPYVFDCALETDERGESMCQEWAKGGLCDINRATQFLFCRKTCLCIGILDSPKERTNQ